MVLIFGIAEFLMLAPFCYIALVYYYSNESVDIDFGIKHRTMNAAKMVVDFNLHCFFDIPFRSFHHSFSSLQFEN